jgi:transcriptional regulator with XRE-family HTH domain
MSDTNKKIGLKIKKIREAAGISQEKLSQLLGVSRPTISQIETADRKLSADEVIRLSEILNVSANSLLDLEREVEVILPERKIDYENDIFPPQEKSFRINVPQNNLDKFKEVLIYILNRIGSKPNVGETVIYKLLYFIDFNFYEKYEEQFIGATYIKNHYGPTPVEFKKIIEKMMLESELEKVESNYFSYPQTKYLPLRKPDLSRLKAVETQVIDDVLQKLSDMNAGQISDYSHGDVPWLTTPDGEIIEYESVFYRSPLYSVKEYK